MINKTYYISLKSNKLYLLNIYIHFLQQMANLYNFDVKKKNMNNNNLKFSVYKSPHVYKKAKEHYYTTWYQTTIVINRITNLSILKFLLKNKPIEIFCKISYKL